MAKVDYKKIWQELKEECIEDYIMLQGYIRVLQSDTQRFPRIEHYKSLSTNIEETLKRMDMLEGTNEFDNLLHDLRRLHGDDPKQ
ncbi:hypothetical protein BU643_06350 [Staphylococcus chromogenes]|uniref:hypothetical protein n=1 Tax=Staphylococcus chromogenes TaxID=46126 RepID=UPI000D1BFECC|nr:hypothetical protein [Staphylococcus chromogenes]PTG93706.1 hypothetical protein BU643_06350 [Staphylococcus chromogenes]